MIQICKFPLWINYIILSERVAIAWNLDYRSRGLYWSMFVELVSLWGFFSKSKFIYLRFNDLFWSDLFSFRAEQIQGNFKGRKLEFTALQQRSIVKIVLILVASAQATNQRLWLVASIIHLDFSIHPNS